MQPTSLVGKKIVALLTFPSGSVHPAWKSELTTPIVTAGAFLELSGGDLLTVDACEIHNDPGKYPSLGLELRFCDRSELTYRYSSGEVAEAQPLDGTSFLPATLDALEESDPLGEGVTSQYELVFGGSRVIFRHIMPPTTLGIALDLAR